MDTHQEEVKKRLGALITEGYKSAGLTRGALSAAVGLSARSLYAIETGQATPRQGTQLKLEEFFGWKKGSIAELLSVGRGVDLEQVTQRTMRVEASAEWVAAAPVELDETARRIQEDVQALSNRLREREVELASERERASKLQEDLHQALEALRAEQRRSEALANGFDLAADDSPNKGAELRAQLDEVAEGNRNVGGVG